MELTRRVWDVVNFQRAPQTSNHHHRALFDCFDASGKNEVVLNYSGVERRKQPLVSEAHGRAAFEHAWRGWRRVTSIDRRRHAYVKIFKRTVRSMDRSDEPVLIIFFRALRVLIGWFGRAKAMSDDSVLGALYGRREVPSVFELEQRVLALHCSYKQRQSSLVEQFQRSQQELAVRHYAESQHLLDEFMKERSCHAPVARHASLPTMSSPIPRANSIEASTSTNGSSPASCASGVQTSGTISDRTKEKLKVS
ncbi:hypothetical protein D917_03177 [Trichinella nativa]|uniref:Uncharacterized protein n=1 Tax=Trichinella nativa TaxID=6335 RepID=A0A1Y3E9R2_9BILA|nr:hypothetical protein D917_03177 [Trichinella nativa]